MTIANGSPDLLVVGAGIFGLSVAWAAHRRGLTVRVIEARRVGAGASGGVVGALSPHVPDQWNPKKQFQLEALLAAEAHWAAVAARAGLSPGYARTGRLMPILSEDAAARARSRAEDATRNWGKAAAWEVVPPDAAPGWLTPKAAPHGLIRETLSARIFPRDACRALATALRAEGVEIAEHTPATAIEDGTVRTPTGTLTADRIVVAAGVPGFTLMEDTLGPNAGTGVKGQAALLDAAAPPDAPVLFADGLYVIPHEGGRIAVGSTSENRYDAPDTTDAQLDAVIAAARTLCPALEHAPVLERWAGLRPKARRRDPMLGPVPGMQRVLLATGGFKIGFGIAHKVGEVVAAMATGEAPDLPDSFTVAHHIR